MSSAANKTMNIDDAIQAAMKIIMAAEGFRSHPYLCPAGVPTIGYGTTWYPDGGVVTLRDAPISKLTAQNLLLHAVKNKFLPAVINLCPGADTPSRLAALVSFVYNLGVSALKTSTLRKRVNAQNWPEAVYEIKRWNKSKGKVLAGLVVRRNAEAMLLQ